MAAHALRRRKPWVAEVLIIAWLTLCVLNVVQALRGWSYFTPPIYEWWWTADLVAPVIAGFWGLARQRRWRAVVVCAGIVVSTGIASGTVQVFSCPHAIYFQVLTVYVPVSGRPCNNEQQQNLTPWWMKRLR